MLDLVSRPLGAGAAQGEARQLVAQAGGAARLPCPGYMLILCKSDQDVFHVFLSPNLVSILD